MSGLSFVVFGDDWGRHVSTLQHLFARVAAQAPVLWVNSFGHRVPRLTGYDLARAGRKAWRMVTAHAQRRDGAGGSGPVRVVEPRALPWHHVSAVRRFNRWSLGRDVRRALAGVRDRGDTVLVSGTPLAADLVGTLGEAASVYFCMDDYGELPGVSRTMLAPYEERMLARVDAVIATAQQLVERKRPATGRAYYLPQGVNFAHFATPQPCPTDLATLPRPIVGFAGGVSDCVDYGLVRAVAQSMPHASIVLVGPVTTETGPEQLADLPNVHGLGNRPYDDLPGYVQQFDVGIIPYVLNDWTRAVDPLKLLEYLAAGIPVVTTRLPEVEKYREAVAIAEAVDPFVAAVRAVAAGDGPPGRQGRDVAADNRWEARVGALMGIASELVAVNRASRAGGQGVARTPHP